MERGGTIPPQFPMVTCPRCKHRFPLAQATQDAFEMFHVVRDAYAKVNNYDKQFAKNELCVLFGVSVECEPGWKYPDWPGMFVNLWGKEYFRKSTLAYTKLEMTQLIEGATGALYDAGGEL